VPLAIIVCLIGIAVGVLLHWGLGVLIVIAGLILLVLDHRGGVSRR
jgi:hypothetical protein